MRGKQLEYDHEFRIKELESDHDSFSGHIFFTKQHLAPYLERLDKERALEKTFSL